MDIRFELQRIKKIMGVITETTNQKCLPKDYRPGKRYGRDELTKIFICYTGKESKFPFAAVREWLFPKLPDGTFYPQDPMKLSNGIQTFTMEQSARLENQDTRNISMKIINLDINIFPGKIEKWFETKRNVPGYDKRLEYQVNKIKENGMNTLSVTPSDEPIVFQSIDKKLYPIEGWHRILAILELVKNKEIEMEQAKVYAVIVYRAEHFSSDFQDFSPADLTFHP